MHYYGRLNRDVTTTDAETPERKDRTDQVSYVSVENQVKSFIASGQAVTSLRHTTMQEEPERAKKLEEVLEMPMNDFTRHIYGMDISEAYKTIQTWNRMREGKEKENKEEIEKLKKLRDHIKELAEKEEIKGE